VRTPETIYVHISDGSPSDVLGIVNFQWADNFEREQDTPLCNRYYRCL
jgi:hypothetical protein